jgi:DNA gyrase subunit A
MKKDEVLLVSSDGHGKRTPVERFRLTHRNTKGVQGIAFKDDNSCLAGFEIVRPDDEVVIVSTSKLIRLRVDDIRQTERRTYGSRLIDLKPKEVVVSLGKFK